MSWHPMMEFEPPLVSWAVSEIDFSFVALNATRQCALNIPTVDVAAQVVGCGNISGAQVDKFARFGLMQAPASVIAAQLINECYAKTRMQCRRYALEEPLQLVCAGGRQGFDKPGMQGAAHAAPPQYGLFMVAGETIELASRMRYAGALRERARLCAAVRLPQD